MTAPVGKGMAMCACRFWSLESILPRSALDNTVIELLLPQKCSLLCRERCLLRPKPNPSDR